MQDEAEPAEEVTLAVPLGTVCYIVQKAQDLQGKSASTSETEDLEDDDIDASVLEDRISDPVDLELRSVISDLNDDAQVDLVALMWLGRDGGDWAELRDIAEQEHTRETARYLCGTPHLAEHLIEGLGVLDLDCSDWFSENA